MQEMIYLKSAKNHPNGRFCVGNHQSKNVSKKIKGGFSPLSLPPRSAYANPKLLT